MPSRALPVYENALWTPKRTSHISASHSYHLSTRQMAVRAVKLGRHYCIFKVHRAAPVPIAAESHTTS